MNDILNWPDSTVTWGENVYDVSENMAMRLAAMKFDDARQCVRRYAQAVATSAQQIVDQMDAGYMPIPLHHQRPSDLNEAITKMSVYAEVLNSLVSTAVETI